MWKKVGCCSGNLRVSKDGCKDQFCEIGVDGRSEKDAGRRRFIDSTRPPGGNIRLEDDYIR